MRRPFSTLLHRLLRTPAHDPMDWRKGPGSGHWNTDTYCSNCKGWTGHSDRMAGICHHCGSRKGVDNYRSARYIWGGRYWSVQYKYGDGPGDYDIVS